MADVIIIGAGGHGKVVADVVRACGDTVLGFLDDRSDLPGVLGNIQTYREYPDAEFIIAIGDNVARERIAGMLDGVKWHTAVHPSAVVSPSAEIGEGTVVMPCAVVNAGASIGRHCIINTAAVAEHDNVIGDFCHISVGAKLGGSVTVGKSTMIGIGAAVRNNIRICGCCTVGAGAAVVSDIKEPGTYIGVPARLMV